jgi:hypothetical protein
MLDEAQAIQRVVREDPYLAIVRAGLASNCRLSS